MFIIPSTWEAESGDHKFEANLGNLVRLCLKIKFKEMKMDLNGRALASHHKVLGSIPSSHLPPKR
jgi:hypothetical protein